MLKSPHSEICFVSKYFRQRLLYLVYMIHAALTRAHWQTRGISGLSHTESLVSFMTCFARLLASSGRDMTAKDFISFKPFPYRFTLQWVGRSRGTRGPLVAKLSESYWTWLHSLDAMSLTSVGFEALWT